MNPKLKNMFRDSTILLLIWLILQFLGSSVVVSRLFLLVGFLTIAARKGTPRLIHGLGVATIFGLASFLFISEWSFGIFLYRLVRYWFISALGCFLSLLIVPYPRIKRRFIAVVISSIGILLVIPKFYLTVPAGSQAIPVYCGEARKGLYAPGLHILVNPFLSWYIFDTNKMSYQEARDEAAKNGPNR